MIVTATRLHGASVLRDDPELRALGAFLARAAHISRHVAVAVGAHGRAGRKLLRAVRAVASKANAAAAAASPPRGCRAGSSLTCAEVAALGGCDGEAWPDESGRTPSTTLSSSASSSSLSASDATLSDDDLDEMHPQHHHVDIPLVTVLPVYQWGNFVPALNALTSFAVQAGAARLLFMSVEVELSPRGMSRLSAYMDAHEAETLCVGPKLDGHEFRGRGAAAAASRATASTGASAAGSAAQGRDVTHVTHVPLAGATTPWNTCALYHLPKLQRTGFLAVSEGGADRALGGVEEVALICAQQRLFGASSTNAVLLQLDDDEVVWHTRFSGAERAAWQAKKMASKNSRARAQLSALGWDSEADTTRAPATVLHVVQHFATQRSTSGAEAPPRLPVYTYIDPLADAHSDVVLVTGGAGFIGSHTAEALLRRGNTVVVVDDFNDYYAVSQKEANIAHLRRNVPGGKDRLCVVRGDICDSDKMRALFVEHGVSRVVHLAARAGVRPSLEDPLLYVRTNMTGTTTLLELARQHGVKHFVYASSSSVYGGSTKDIFSELDQVDAPVSPYAASKKACELMASTYNHLYGLPVAGLRFFTVYGPRGRPDMAPFMFLDRAHRSAVINQFGDGTSERDYTYVADIVSGVVRALDRPSVDGPQVYNLGNGRPITLKRFIGLVGKTTGKPLNINLMPNQPGDVRRTCADITKAAVQLGYAPRTSFEQGLAQTYEWYTSR